MAKQLNVSLAFTADTTQAKNAIQSLVNDLTKLSSGTGLSKDLPITKEIMEAQVAAKQLGDTLQASLNTQSGKLDLTKFTQSLKTSGMSLTDYGNKLSSLGVQGDQAFLKIAQAIAKTQAPLRQSSGLLTQFSTALKNTARWQISSSILHGFLGAVQSAYGYAQDLNESLTNIGIVTSQNAEQMASFANQANKAAQALNTTTTKYANASLIYYQQGLPEEEVAKRTEVTIKMANAAGQSAEIISDQLTAVWNNFYDGSKSLEYYADVMTALGAATASSTDEIAGGLEKFAAIGQTIGLSYEYAASALATITSNTRQSEEVVGTALKTIFARIQGLNLGETLDDGTTLNKYSKALESVGISIFDSVGELKTMDSILDEMAEKWETLSSAQQVALAQTVAGTRQYTQLVALMDNWNSKTPDDKDSMVANLDTSYNATGTLQKQADIYAESWEASKDRVRAALEEIYNTLIDSDFFIGLNDTFTKVLNGISSIINAMGGLKGVLGMVGMVLLKSFGSDLTQGINNAVSNFRIFTGAAQADLQSLKKEAYDAAMTITAELADTPGIQSLRSSLENTYTLQNQLTDAVRRMSPEQRAVAEEALKTAQHYNDIAVEAGLAAEKAGELYQNSLKAGQALRETSMNTMQQHYDNSVGQSGSELLASARGMKGSASALGVNTEGLDNAIKKYSAALHDENISQDSAEFKEIAAKLRAELDAVATAAANAGEGFKKYEGALMDSAQQVTSNQKQFEKLKSTLVNSSTSGKDFADGVEKAANAAKAAGGSVEILEQKLAKYRKLIAEGKTGTEEFKIAEQDLRRELDITHISTEQATQQVAKLANTAQDGSNNIKVLGDKQMEQADAARQSAMANTNAGEAVEVAGKKSTEAATKIKMTSLAYQSLGSAFTGSLRAMTSFAMGLNSLKSIQDTLNNTELTSFEKTTQVMMSLGMAIPALISGLKGVGNAFHFVFSAQKKGLTGQIAYLLGAKQEINTSKVLVVSKTGEVLARGAAGDAAVQEALKTEGATMVTKLDTVATWENIAAKLMQHWYILVIIAAIGILIGVIYSLIKAYNKEADAAKLAAKQAEQLKNAYDETKQAAEDLKSTIDKYKDAKDAMSGLKVNTLEYKEALLEANEQALELLKTYEGLAKYASRNKEGLIIISDEGLDEILNQQYQKLDRMQTLQLDSELKASKAQEKSDILNFARSQEMTYDSMDSTLNAIMAYFKTNNITELIPSDIDKLTSLTEEQRNAISSNIEGYSQMANSLISTNEAQALLTQSYLDAAWRLNNPDAQPDESGRYAPEDVMSNSLFNTYQNRYYLSEDEQAAAVQAYKDKVYEQWWGEDGIKDIGEILLSSPMYDPNTGYYSPGFDPTKIGGSDAAYYAHLAGYDMNDWYQTENGIWDGGGKAWPTQLGSATDPDAVGVTKYWDFSLDGTKTTSLTSDQLAQAIADEETKIMNARMAEIEAPEVLANVNQILEGLENNKNLANLMYSAEMDQEGNGQFTMPDYYMSQDEAQSWLDNWSSITAQFEGKMTDTGFWEKMGFESGDAFLSSLNSWLTDRSKMNDAEAFNTSGINVSQLKTTSDNVSAKVKNGDLTSATADDDVSYQNMVMYAKDLLQIYPELTEAANTFSNAGLIGTQEWIAAYDTIAEKINSLDAMAKASDNLQGLKDKTGKDYTQFFKEQLNAEEQVIFAQVDINKYQSEAAIKAEIARLQKIADANEIEVKMTAIESAQSELKEDMSADDWINMRDNTLDWGQDGIIEFNEFLNMTYEQQQAYLTRLSEKTQNDLLANKNAALQGLETSLNGITDPTEQAAIQTEIDLLTSEIAIYEKLSMASLMAATSLDDLHQKMSQKEASGMAVDAETYGNALVALGEQYNSCTQEIQEFQAALASSNAELITAKTEQLEAAISMAEAAEEYGIAEDTLEEVSNAFEALADSGEEQYKILKEDGEALSDATVRYVRLQEAVLDLAENYDDYSKVLEDVQDANDDIDKAMIANSKSGKALQKSLADLLGTSEDLVDAKLLDAIDPKDFEKAAKGDEKAIERIRDAFVELQAEANGIDVSGLKSELADLEEGVVVDINADEMPLLYALIQAKVAAGAGAAEIEAMLSGFNIDADVSDFVGSMSEMAAASAQAGSEVIANTSFSQDVETVAVDNPVTKEDVGFTESYTATPHTETSKILKDGAEEATDVTETYYSWDKTVTPNVQSETETNEQAAMSVKTSNAAGESGQVKGVQIKNAHKSSGSKVGGGTKKAANNAGSGNGGGGGSKPKKTSDAKKKKSEIVDRYKEVNDQLEQTQRAMKKNTTLADALWGSDRIKMLQENIDLMEQEYDLLNDKAKLAKSYLKEDKTFLQDAVKKFGYSFEIDKDTGLITNYTEVMEKVYKKREQLLAGFGDTMDEKEQEKLAEFDEWLSELESAYDQYEQTLDENKDLEEERLAKLLEIQTAYYDKLNEELEVNLSINEDDLATIEYYLEKMADDFYKMAEAAALMVGSLEKLMAKQFGGQAQSYLSNLDYYKNYMAQLEHDFTTINPETGETYINKQQYVEGMREAKAGIIENLTALNELDRAMMNYYEDTLAAGAEELAKYTDVMENQTRVLEHYANIMSILGKEKDYEGMGVILSAQAKTLENEVAVAEANYNMLRNQADLRKQAYEEAEKRGASESELELLKNEWWAAENAAAEAQDAMLSKTEEWAEAMKAVVENKLNGLAQSLENALTGDFGGSFEAMTNRLERANSLQEEFLTTTNQIYETNKLMRTAQQEIDKSTNSVAKRKLKSFIDETEQLQNQTKLSQYELDIQQAKYDLLLAEIALSEASNAKSTVRLQRDSEGNFGYVYTADSNAVEEAEQQFEDAQNRLYNIGLEGANQYTEKYQQTLSEFYDTMTELQTRYLNGEFENEAEYQEAMETARKYYYEKLQQYSSLYSIALTTDARVVEDAWSTEFQNMTLNTNQWMRDVNGYVGEVGKVFQEWGKIQQTVADKTIGPSLDALKTKTENIVTASTNLVGIITGENGVLAGLEAEFTDVTNLTGAYASLRQEMLDAIGAHEDLIEEIDQNIKDADKKEPKTETPTEQKPPEEKPPEEKPTDNGGGKNYDAKTKRGVALAIWNGGYGWGTGKTRRQNLAAKGFDPDEIQSLVNNTNPNGGWEKRYGISDLSQYAFSKFDTGGYTGDWGGSYGKLAMLHKKELVLNEGDTANFLAGMEILDKVISMIDLYSTNAQLGGILNSPSFSSYGNNNDTLEQNVHIEASFPGVSDRHEIEEALNSLVNRASQFAGRR